MKRTINGNILELTTADLTKEHVDAIVNAANGTLLGGGGVDGAIHKAAGPELLEACKQIRQEQLHGELLATGEVVLTKGYDLPAKHIIHTVGPIWSGNEEEGVRLLGNCYRNSLLLAKEQGFKSIAFPSISTGVYRFPIQLAARTAMETIYHFLQSHQFGTVKMVLFSPHDYDIYANAANEIS